MDKRRLVVGISGASGAALATELLCQLKERRKLVLAVRETPLSPVHLRNM